MTKAGNTEDTEEHRGHGGITNDSQFAGEITKQAPFFVPSVDLRVLCVSGFDAL